MTAPTNSGPKGLTLDAAGMVDRYRELAEANPIIVIEDGLAEDDWGGWRLLTETIGDRAELVGDDLFVTNVERIEWGIRENAADSVLIKPNQIGTVTETIAAGRLAQQNGWGAMVSHRSGETVDTFIADFTVAMQSGHLKTGAPARGERVEKYNQLIQDQRSGRRRFPVRRPGRIRPVGTCMASMIEDLKQAIGGRLERACDAIAASGDPEEELARATADTKSDPLNFIRWIESLDPRPHQDSPHRGKSMQYVDALHLHR